MKNAIDVEFEVNKFEQVHACGQRHRQTATNITLLQSLL